MTERFDLHLERGLDNRDQALAALEQHYAGFLLAMREEARRVCARVGRVTTDDLRTLAKIKGVADVDPHAWGAIFKERDTSGELCWRSIGRTPSTLAQNNGRLISLWVLR